jgi:hypothetical protein
MYKIIARAAVGGTAALALAAFGLLGAAGAGASQVGQHYSEFLAGHVLQGNGPQAYEAVWGGTTVPDEPSTVPANSIAVGIAMGQNVSVGGAVYGEALVWDSTAGTCGASSWTLEGGNFTSVTTPMPVPISDMSPLVEFGDDVCIAPGGYLWLKLQQSTSHGVMSFIAGPSEHDNDVLLQDHGVHEHFLAPAEGVTTTSGADAATLALGTLVSFDTWAVTDLASHAVGAHAVNKNALAFNYGTFTGTETGGVPSVSNPVTLTPSSFTKVGFGSANTVSVP